VEGAIGIRIAGRLGDCFADPRLLGKRLPTLPLCLRENEMQTSVKNFKMRNLES
jgi:hypothetical protein